MKIISGQFSGKHITYQQRSGQRVTGEKVRKAVFDMLDQYVDIDGIEVADIFAGSGMYGFEAYSRGAGRVVFIDNSREAVKYLKQNVRYLGMKDSAQIRCENWDSFIRGNKEVFDLVFVDPPYYDFDYSKLLSVGSCLASNGIVVVESSRRIPVLKMSDDMVLLESRTYGDVRVDIFQKRG